MKLITKSVIEYINPSKPLSLLDPHICVKCRLKSLIGLHLTSQNKNINIQTKENLKLFGSVKIALNSSASSLIYCLTLVQSKVVHTYTRSWCMYNLLAKHNVYCLKNII